MIREVPVVDLREFADKLATELYLLPGCSGWLVARTLHHFFIFSSLQIRIYLHCLRPHRQGLWDYLPQSNEVVRVQSFGLQACFMPLVTLLFIAYSTSVAVGQSRRRQPMILRIQDHLQKPCSEPHVRILLIIAATRWSLQGADHIRLSCVQNIVSLHGRSAPVSCDGMPHDCDGRWLGPRSAGIQVFRPIRWVHNLSP